MLDLSSCNVSVQVCVNLGEGVGIETPTLAHSPPPLSGSRSRAKRIAHKSWTVKKIDFVGRKLAASLEDILYGPREIESMQKNLQRWPAGQPLLLNCWLIMQFVATAISCVSRDRLAPVGEEHTRRRATNPFDQFLSLSLSFLLFP